MSELFVYEKFSRAPADTVEAGDICAVCGIDDIQVIICFGSRYYFYAVSVKLLTDVLLFENVARSH